MADQINDNNSDLEIKPTVPVPASEPQAAEAKASEPTNETPAFDKSQINPLDVKDDSKAYDSDVLKNIIDTETMDVPEKILEEAPELDTSLLEEVGPTKSFLLIGLKSLFGVLLLGSIASLLFFTSQLTPSLEFIAKPFNVPNVSKELKSTNTEVISLQTSLNFYRFLQLKAYLDQFSYLGDSYIHFYEIAGSQTTANESRRDASEQLITLRENIKKSFLTAADIISKPFEAPLIDPDLQDVEQIFRTALITRLGDQAREFGQAVDTEAKAEQKNYLQTMKLVGNTSLQTLMVNTDFDALSDKELYDIIKRVNSLVVNDLSIIQKIKNQRVKWSDVMNEIELRTIAVDRNYSDDFYEQIGGIQYTNYSFDKEGPQITIVGQTKRFDTTNFTMISNLIDSFNSSEMFANAEMRSFSKAGSLDSGYTANLRLVLDLLTMEEPQSNAPAL